MQKDNLDLLAEKYITDYDFDKLTKLYPQNKDTIDNVKNDIGRINNSLSKFNNDNIKHDLNNNVVKIKTNIPDPNGSYQEPDNKYKQPICLQNDDGEWYCLIPNDLKKDIYNPHTNSMHHQRGITPQRGMNAQNRFTLNFGGISRDQSNGKYKDDDDLLANTVQNSKLISYDEYERNAELQLELGQKLQQFYKDKNIPLDQRALEPYNTSVLKRYIAHHKALEDDPDYRRNISTLSGTERDKYQKDYLKNATRKTKKYSKDIAPLSAGVPRADDINPETSKNIKLNIFKRKLKDLNPSDRDLFNKVQLAITGPFKTTQSPNDLMLLINNFKDIADTSKDNYEIRKNWEKLKRSQIESIYVDLLMYDTSILTEGSLDYDQKVLYDILRGSGVYFSPTHLEYLSNLYLFNDYWQEIPIKGRTNTEIFKDWNDLVEKYWLRYYVPLMADKLKSDGLLDPKTEIDIDSVVNKLKSQIRNVFDFRDPNYIKFKDKQRLVFNAITGEDLDQTKAAASLEKRLAQQAQDDEDLLSQAMKYYKKESRYDEMITKVLKKLIG